MVLVGEHSYAGAGRRGNQNVGLLLGGGFGVPGRQEHDMAGLTGPIGAQQRGGMERGDSLDLVEP